jgi:hypothetical protein
VIRNENHPDPGSEITVRDEIIPDLHHSTNWYRYVFSSKNYLKWKYLNWSKSERLFLVKAFKYREVAAVVDPGRA